jgi:S1-C subfamily serine protease
MLLALLVAAALVLSRGVPRTLFGGNGGGTTTASGTPAGSTTPDYDTGVVNINAILGSRGGAAAGTGMILDAGGTVLTNNHVVQDATSITATDVNTGRRYSASVVGTDASDDIAVLRLRNASGLTPISTGNSAAVQVGQQVVAVGNAGGRGGTPAVVTGRVTALNQTITATDSDGANAETLNGLIQVDAPIVAGDSGGPLTDSSGKVIGIDTAASASTTRSGTFPGRGGFVGNSGSGTSLGFAIPISKALTVAKQIESGQSDSSGNSGGSDSSGQGYLGVEVTDGSSVGATVGGTVIGSPAEAAGISAGDVITALDGHDVASASDLSQQLSGTHPGQQVTVTWTDESGNSASATLTLMAGSAS